MDQQKILLFIIVLILSVGLSAFGGHVVINKISDKVIEKLKREYVPGPYQPGFDPDKIEPKFKQPATPGKVFQEISPQSWNEMWEQSRY